MNTPPLSLTEFDATLPKHIAGAGVILRDGHGRVVLVRPRYRHDTWEIPGGAVERWSRENTRGRPRAALSASLG